VSDWPTNAPARCVDCHNVMVRHWDTVRCPACGWEWTAPTTFPGCECGAPLIGAAEKCADCAGRAALAWKGRRQ
jgi:hypothetical protein